MKTCSKCGIEKELTEFHIDARARDGKQSQCKECFNTCRRNSEAVKEYRKKYNMSNRERISIQRLGYMRQYCKVHRVRLKAASALYRKSLGGMIRRWWSGINSRAINGSHPNPSPRNRSYIMKKIRLEMTFEEFESFVLSQKDTIDGIRATNDIPSIDRKDSNGHYSIDNIRIIPLKQNCSLGGKTTAKIRATIQI